MPWTVDGRAVVPNPNMLRTHVYVDGNNLFEAVRRHGGPRFVNISALARFAARQSGEWLGMFSGVARVLYYDAEPDAGHAEREERLRYFESLEALPDVHVRRGFLRRASRSSRRTQKGVDVLLAVDMLEDAYRRIMDVAMLVSGDGDFAPVVEAVRQYGPRVVVVSYSDKLSDDLRLAADMAVELDKLEIPIPPLALSTAANPEKGYAS